jgi:hypothetical protein
MLLPNKRVLARPQAKQVSVAVVLVSVQMIDPSRNVTKHSDEVELCLSGYCRPSPLVLEYVLYTL